MSGYINTIQPTFIYKSCFDGENWLYCTCQNRLTMVVLEELGNKCADVKNNWVYLIKQRYALSIQTQMNEKKNLEQI